ncbi:MAG: hypothetical protein KatS3mg018_1637 [Fimbriimonadales bacterium]|nr:MAG: hypothetical protein KatS3mg018_1637 [Fimbriimonadales bacterium]
MTPEEILRDYPDLEREDLQAAMLYLGILQLRGSDVSTGQ